jgi:hypothetical protein
MFGNVSPAVVLLFKISIIGYCCFGDQQSFSERQVSRPWIQELLTQEKSRNLTSATTNADGYLKSQNVQLSRIPTDVSLQVFRFAGNKSLQRKTKSNARTILFVPKLVIAVGTIAAAIAVAVTSHGKHDKIEEIDFDFRLLNILTPINDLPMPVTGVDFPSDGCGDNSVRFNGTCFPVLHKGPCHRIEWVTMDPITLQVNSRQNFLKSKDQNLKAIPLGTMHSTSLRSRKGISCSRWTLSRYLRSWRVPRWPTTLLYGLRRSHMRLPNRTISISAPP